MPQNFKGKLDIFCIKLPCLNENNKTIMIVKKMGVIFFIDIHKTRLLF